MMLLFLVHPDVSRAQNALPTLPFVDDQTVNELTQLAVIQTATEADANASLSYFLLNPPAGAVISANGIFTWTPSQSESPGNYLLTAVATSTDTSDPVNPQLSATNQFFVTVQEVNVAPVLPVIANQAIPEAMLLSVINTATDSNIHDTLSYRLVSPPAGVAIDGNGIVSWIPTPAQANSTNVITTIVTAANSEGTPSLTATNSFTVIVSQNSNTYTWTNRLGDDWRSTNSWSPNGTPGPGDTAYIPYFTGNGTNPLVLLNINTTVGNLTLGGGSGSQSPTLSGTASITVTGKLSWQGGTILGKVQCGGGTLTGNCYLGGQLINTGTLAWNDAILNDINDSVISNALEGIINITANGAIAAGQYTAGTTFSNAGQINVLNSVAIANAFENTGTGAVTVNAGTLSLENGGGNMGTIDVATNASLQFVGSSDSTFTCTSSSYLNITNNLLFNSGIVDLAGTVSVEDSNIFSGATVNVTGDYSTVSPLVISSGTVNLNGTSALTPSVLTMSGGTLAGSTPVMINGPLNWSGGTIEGAVQCNGGTLSGEAEDLVGGQLINTGTLAWNVFELIDGGGSVVSNAPGAVIDFTVNTEYGTDAVTAKTSGTAMFYNAGQLNVFAGTNEFTLGDTFVNTGTVTVDSGTLNLQGSGTSSNTINVATNATLELFGGGDLTFTFTSGSYLNVTNNLLLSAGIVNLEGMVSVSGTNIFSGATVNVTGDYPITSPMVISGGMVNLNGTGALTPSMLTMSGGTLTNSAPVLINGPLNWSGGTIEGVVQCNGGTMSGEAEDLLGGQLINTGTLAWNVFELIDGQGSVISNAPGATINFTVNSKYGTVAVTSETYGTANFYNAGQLNILAATNEFAINDTFVNTSIVTVNSGTFSLQGSGTNYSTMNVGRSATLGISPLGANTFTCTGTSFLNVTNNLLFGAGTVNLAGMVSVAGTNTFNAEMVNVTGDYLVTGPLVILGNIVNFNGTVALTPSMMTMSGGILTNSLPLLVNGPLNWSGGTIEGMVQCNGGSLNGEVDVLNGGELINTGTLAWNVSSLEDGDGSVISNAPGATIDFTVNLKYGTTGGTADVYGASSGGQTPATLYNAGQLNVAAGTNQFNIDDTLINSGAVTVNSGTLALQNGGINSNTITVAANATLEISLYPLFIAGDSGAIAVCTFPTLTFASGSSLADKGNFVIGGGAILDPPNTPITGCGTYTVNLAGTGFVTGTNTFDGTYYSTTSTVAGNYQLTNSMVISGGTVNFNGTNAVTPSLVTMSSGVLTNSLPVVIYGPLYWTGGTIEGVVQFNGGVLTNSTVYLDGGELINTGTFTWTNATINDGKGSVISNAPGATINLMGSGSVTHSNYAGSPKFANAGQLNVSADPNPATFVDSFTNTGTVSLNAGTFSTTVIYTQTAGLTLLNGGNISNSLPLQVQGGTFAGNGTVFGSISNSGIVSPGNPLGKIVIGGNYIQTTNGILNIELGGTLPGTNFGLLFVTNASTLAGTLTVGLTNGFYPTNNALFTFLYTKAINGAFANFLYPSNSVGMQVNYAANAASIQITNVRPVLAPIGNYTVNPGQTVAFTASATDSIPTRTLTFSLGSGPGTIGPSSGAYNWRPPVASANTTNNVQVTVTDNSAPPLSDSTSFNIMVNPLAPLKLNGPAYNNGQFTMQISGTQGPDYIIAASTNLMQWTDVLTNASPSTPFDFTDPSAGGFSNRFYRVRLTP